VLSRVLRPSLNAAAPSLTAMKEGGEPAQAELREEEWEEEEVMMMVELSGFPGINLFTAHQHMQISVSDAAEI
jgi:hypothetical protein